MFTLQDVEAMRRDYQIALGLYMLKSPLFTLEWAVQSKNQELSKFIDATLTKIWKPHIFKILRSFEYGYTGGEILYKLKDNKIVFAGYKEFHPRDIRALTRGHEYVGFRVKNVMAKNDVDLFPPKGFWFAIDKEFGGWYGRSYLLNVWEPWFEKRSRDGAIEIRRLWFYKNAYTGGIIRHPLKDYVMPDGTIYSAREMAREMAEKLKTGGIVAFPGSRDERGEYQWALEHPQINGNAQEIREYPHDLDLEIMRGLGIPDSVLTDQPGTGSYAGRRVPERAFYVRLEGIIHQLVEAIKIQILDPLVYLNFAGDLDYEIITKPLVEIMSPEGTPPPGAEGGQPGMPQQISGTAVGNIFGGSSADLTNGLSQGQAVTAAPNSVEMRLATLARKQNKLRVGRIL